MNYYMGGDYSNIMGVKYGTFGLLIPLMILDLILRGISLWRAAKKDQSVWFIALLVVNSMGILPLIYLVLNRVQSEPSKKTSKRK